MSMGGKEIKEAEEAIPKLRKEPSVLLVDRHPICHQLTTKERIQPS